MKTPPIDITLGQSTYKVRIGHLDMDRFYALMRAAALNKVTNSSPVLDDKLEAELWTIFTHSGSVRRRLRDDAGPACDRWLRSQLIPGLRPRGTPGRGPGSPACPCCGAPGGSSRR